MAASYLVFDQRRADLLERQLSWLGLGLGLAKQEAVRLMLREDVLSTTDELLARTAAVTDQAATRPS